MIQFIVYLSIMAKKAKPPQFCLRRLHKRDTRGHFPVLFGRSLRSQKSLIVIEECFVDAVNVVNAARDEVFDDHVEL